MIDESEFKTKKFLTFERLDTTLQTESFCVMCTSTFTFSLDKGATRTTWRPRDLHVRKLIADKLELCPIHNGIKMALMLV